MLKGLKIRLYPNKIQENYINNLLGSYRFVYNQCLNYKKSKFIEENENITLSKLGEFLFQNLLKNPKYYWLKEHNTKVLNQSLFDLLDSYKRFFVNGNGFPCFKSKHDNILSCRFPLQAISKLNNYQSNKLTLTKDLKNVKFRCSERYKEELSLYQKNIKSATLSKTKTNKYYLSILIDDPILKTLPHTTNEIGIDLGIKDFIITSDGTRYENIKIKRKHQKKLKRLHKQLSKKQKGSKNKEKCRIKLAKYNEKLSNIKENYLHVAANSLLNENQVIAMENLNVKGMMKNHKLARSIQELSLYRFKEILRYKAGWYGRKVVEIDRFYPSSKLCNICGFKNVDLALKDREWICPECGTKHDRDINAAINILKTGKRILIPMSDGKFKPLEIESLDSSVKKEEIR